MNRARILLLAGLLLAACAPTPSTPQTGDLCLSQAAFQSSLESFRALEPSASAIDQYREAWISVQRTFRDFREKAVKVADDRVAEVSQAVDEVKAALDDVPDDTTPQEALASIEDELAAVTAAVDALDAELDCPTQE
jgi:hypothetical protein